MKIIEKIEIKYFRSFDGQPKVEIIDLKDLNIFSGSNDSGKSNILRALNLFFNNEVSPGVSFNIDRDLSKIQKNRSDAKANERRSAGLEARQKDLWVKIRVYFVKETEGVLPQKFWVERMWDKNGLNSKRSSNVGRHASAGKLRTQEGQLTQFLHNIKFQYVPAVKDRQFFHYLFQKLQIYLFEKQDKKRDNEFKKHSSEFNKLLKHETGNLFDEFKKNTNIEAQFNIPETLIDFFRTLGVETENGISLFDRGDGIQARFIPDILNEVSRDSRKKVIWGFEEPENSYEPLRCFELAQDFLKYSNEKQIFITSHAFPFIGLKGPKVSSYRVKKEDSISKIGIIDWKQRTIQGPGFENDADALEKEMGLLETYSRLSEHLGKQINKRKYLVFVEDSRKEIYKIAWLKLKNIPFTKDDFEQLFDQECPFNLFDKGGRNDLRKHLDMPVMDELKDCKIVGVFDFDDGFADFNGLKKGRWEDIKGDEGTGLFRKRRDLPCFYAMVIPVPSSRSLYAQQKFVNNYLTLEHLFEDSVLTKTGLLVGFSVPSGGSKIAEVKKKNFWKKLIDLPREDFSNFEVLFSKIESFFN